MEKVTLELETVTPLFIAGADQRNIENEGLRAPSLRGLLRWWFRALAGNHVNNDFKKLKKVENEVFGSSDAKSKVSLKTHHKCSPEIIEKEYRSWHEAIVWSDYVDYLFFSCLDKRKDRRTNRIRVKSRPFYPKGSEFKVIIYGKDNELKVCVASLWALIYLGGVGFRARRGCGCLKIKNVEGNTFGLNFICRNLSELEKFLKDNIETALKIVGDSFDAKCGRLTSMPEYTMMVPNHSALFIKKINGSDWISALNEIGKWYVGQRVGRRFAEGFRMSLADYNFSHIIRNAYRNEQYITSDRERRPYLGLPITYTTYKATLKAKNFDRRSSPLMFGVYEINGSFIPRILIFRSVFLPKFRGNFVVDKKVRAGKRKRKIILNANLPDNNICNEILVDCYNNLKAANWQVVWGSIR